VRVVRLTISTEISCCSAEHRRKRSGSYKLTIGKKESVQVATIGNRATGVSDEDGQGLTMSAFKIHF
jgi:hypothetical protein